MSESTEAARLMDAADMLDFQAKLALEYGEGNIRLSAGQIIPQLTELMRRACADLDAQQATIEQLRERAESAEKRLEEALKKPVAWRREWDGDVSDIGQWVYVEDKSDCDARGPWQPLYAIDKANERG